MIIFTIAIIVIFAGTNIYYFFQSEKYRRNLLVAKRNLRLTEQENKQLQESTAVILFQFEETLKRRFVSVKNASTSDTKLQEKLTIIAPVINNFSTIASETIRANGQLSSIVKSCYGSMESDTFNELLNLIKLLDRNIQRLWKGDNLKGFMQLTDALLRECEKSLSSAPVKIAS